MNPLFLEQIATRLRSSVTSLVWQRLMETLTSRSLWGGGDPVSHALLSLASDRGIPEGMPVTGERIELARRHGLIGALATEVDDPIVKAIHARQLARQGVMTRHLRDVLGRLHGAGIRVAVVKGPAVAAQYADERLRPYSDLDLLVESHALNDALEVIRSVEAVVDVPEKRPKAEKRDVLLRDPSGIRFNLDLHWDLFSYSQLRGSADGAMREAWAAARFLADDELGPRWTLPDDHTINFLAVHAVLDHRFRLILFRDFLELARSEIDWPGVTDAAHRWGLRSTTYLASWIAREAVGADIPADVLRDLRPKSLALRHLEWSIPRLDLVRFDGHTPHPVNLASVLLNDRRRDRISLLVRAPLAFPGWRKRVTAEEARSMHQPRTLIVVSTDLRRGAEVFTERLRDGLVRGGWVVEAVSLRGVADKARADVEVLTVADHKPRRRFDLALVKALRRKIRIYRPDLIVANGGSTLRYSIVARIGLGSSLAYIGIGEPHYWMRSRISRWANRFMLKRADKVIAVSETTRRQLIDLEPSVEDRAHTLFTGLDPSLIELGRPEPTGPLRVVMLGSLTDEKDPMLALRAVAEIENSVLRFVGDGPLVFDLAGEVKRLGVSDRVEFVGSVDDVRPYLSWAHVLILTSRTEGLPGAVLEASAAGLAVVAVDVGGVREAVLHRETGIVTRRDQSDIVSALRELDEDRELVAKFGEAGRRHIADNFLIGDVVERYRAVLREAVR